MKNKRVSRVLQDKWSGNTVSWEISGSLPSPKGNSGLAIDSWVLRKGVADCLQLAFLLTSSSSSLPLSLHVYEMRMLNRGWLSEKKALELEGGWWRDLPYNCLWIALSITLRTLSNVCGWGKELVETIKGLKSLGWQCYGHMIIFL